MNWRQLTGLESGPCENCGQEFSPPTKAEYDMGAHWWCGDKACLSAIQFESRRKALEFYKGTWIERMI